MDNLDFSGLTDDQLLQFYRAVCQEAAARNPAVQAACRAAGLDEAEKVKIAAEAAQREAAAQRARERQRVAEEAVARVRAEGRGSRLPAAVCRRPGDLPERLKEPFYAVRMTLYRSEFQPGGARYVPLAQVELP